MIKTLIYIYLVTMVLMTAGCGYQQPMYALVIDPSHSNFRNFNSDDHMLNLEMVLQMARCSTLVVEVSASDPLELVYEPRTCSRPEILLEDLEKARQTQINNRQPDSRVEKLGLKDGEEYNWGFGTCFSSTLRRLARRHPGNQPLIVVMMSDGKSDCENDDIDAALADLFNAGPTRFILLGASTEICGPDEMVIDRWESSFKNSGATVFKAEEPSLKSYYISPTMILLRALLETGFPGGQS